MSLRYPGGLITKSPTAPTTSAAKGIWTLEQALQYIKAGTWPLSLLGDPYFQYNTLLLPGQGTNNTQNNSFLDSSGNGYNPSRSGETTQGTFSPFSGANGYWSNYFNGSSDWLQAPANAAFAFGTGNFTVEGWVYVAAVPNTYNTIFDGRTSGTSITGFWLSIGSGRDIILRDNGGNYLTSGGVTIALNTWNHIAVDRNSTTLRLYLNGVVVGSVTNSTNFTDNNCFLNRVNDVTTLNGTQFISNFRIVKGASVYNGAFTPPTAPLGATSGGTTPPTGTQTSLLTCQSNRFVDNGGLATPNTLTPSGTPSVTPFQPFGAPTSAYSAATNGGSGYFDGSGDYLDAGAQTAFAFGTGSWTVEAWVYVNSLASEILLFDTRSGASTAGVGCRIATDGTLSYSGSANNALTTSAIKVNEWNHIAWSYDGTTLSGYINGSRGGTATPSFNISQNNGVVGRVGFSAAGYMNGYIGGLRVVKGTAVYSGTSFTVPTAPLTAITNTSLLLNFTNAGIIDNAQDNDLITVADAKISTAQYKWGTSSIYFDGNGDYLSGPSTPALNCGTADFTIEGWIYVSSRTLNYPIIFGNNNGSYTAGALGLVNSSAANVAYNNKFCLNAYDINSSGPPALISSSTNALNTWYHLAVVRVGTTLKMFVNGNQTASVTISSGIVFNWGKGGVLVGGGNWDTTQSYFNGYINDLRLTNGYARYQYPFTAPAAALPLFYSAPPTPTSDPYFDYTTLLLPGNQPSGVTDTSNNVFKDSSANNFTITRNPASGPNAPTQGTFTPFSQTGWGNNFDGSGDYLSCGNNAALSAGAGDFTVEFWLSLNSIGVNDTSLWESRSTNASATGFHIGALALTGGYCINFYTNATPNLTSSLIPYRAWTHIAVVRSGSSLKVYVNGISELSITNSANFSDTPTFTIGQSPLYVSNSLNGDMSNFRMVKGTAVYTGNFSVPTSSLAATQSAGTNIAAITGTQTGLLTCQSNRFSDNSTNAFTITPNGEVKVQAFSPFNPTASYSAATVGGSGYFDGTGDYLTAPADNAFGFGTGDFKIEMWIYPTSIPAGDTGLFYVEQTGGLVCAISPTTGYLGIGTRLTSYDLTSSYKPTTNTWTHVVFSRVSGTGYIFANGTQVATGSLSTKNYLTSVSGLAVVGGNFGNNPAGSAYFPGYISGLVVVKGSGVTSVTVPTAPPSPIGTNLCLNYTNGAIIDSTAKNNLETVGGASISTTQSKFGGSSMYFDGSGDYLIMPNVLTGQFGTGDFTIEYWDYHGTQGTNYANQVGTLSSATPAGTWRLGTFSNLGGLYFAYHNGTTYVDVTFGSAAYNDSTWRHFAISRYNGVLYAFVNGVQVGSATACTQDFNSTNRVILGAELANPTYFTGYLQDVRVTKGIGRYTQNFTPPTTAFLTL
jgi:hypothetical protein